jgi:hypothetical protein
VSSFRRSVELKAGPAFVLLARAPRWVPFVVVLGCVVGGLLLTGPAGAVLLLVVLLLLGVQLFFAWPVLLPPQRLLRASVLGLIVLVVASRF